MCRAFEETRDAAAYQEKIETAQRMIARGKYTIEEIADISGLTIEKVQELARTKTA